MGDILFGQLVSAPRMNAFLYVSWKQKLHYENVALPVHAMERKKIALAKYVLQFSRHP